MGSEITPGHWWHSGRFWYCGIPASHGRFISGCGVSKADAMRDFYREMRRKGGPKVTPEPQDVSR